MKPWSVSNPSPNSGSLLPVSSGHPESVIEIAVLDLPELAFVWYMRTVFGKFAKCELLPSPRWTLYRAIDQDNPEGHLAPQ